MIRWLAILVIACAVIVAACGGGEEDSSETTGGTLPPASPTVMDVPRSPIASPTSADVTPDGWTSYSVEPVELALPPTYVGGPASEAETFQAIRELGSACVAVADSIEPTARGFLFVGVDGATCATSSIHSAQIIPIDVGASATTPSAFVDAFLEGLPTNAELIEETETEIAAQPTAVLTLRRTYPAFTTIQRLYAVRGSDGVWYALTVAATDFDFDAAAPQFDEIAATFRVS